MVLFVLFGGGAEEEKKPGTGAVAAPAPKK